MTFFVTLMVLFISYVVKFKEDFDKEKLSKVGMILFVISLVFILLYWLLH